MRERSRENEGDQREGETRERESSNREGERDAERDWERRTEGSVRPVTRSSMVIGGSTLVVPRTRFLTNL